MENTLDEKAKALRSFLGNPPWLIAIDSGELGGEPAIFVYVNPLVRFWHMPIPEYWRGVKVWLRQAGKSEATDLLE